MKKWIETKFSVNDSLGKIVKIKGFHNPDTFMFLDATKRIKYSEVESFSLGKLVALKQSIQLDLVYENSNFEGIAYNGS